MLSYCYMVCHLSLAGISTFIILLTKRGLDLLRDSYIVGTLSFPSRHTKGLLGSVGGVAVLTSNAKFYA